VPAATRWPWAVAAAVLVFHLVLFDRYGWFRDELYYLACGAHPGWGYVDHPPLIGWIAALLRATLGDSLFAVRLLPALAVAALVPLTAAVARRLGGGAFAQTLAALCAALAPIYLALGSYLSMNAFDLLFWAAAWWCAVRALDVPSSGAGDSAAAGRWWLAFGAIAGVGLLNKVSVLFLGFGIAAGLLLAAVYRPEARRALRDRRLWLGGVLSLLLFSPHLIWQQLHGWPTLDFMDHARRYKIVVLSPGQFLGEQVLLIAPALPVVIAGLVFLLTDRRSRALRPLGWAVPAILALLMVAGSKAYYAGPAYSLLFAAGAVAVEAWSGRLVRGATWGLRGAVAALLIVVGVAVAPIARPVLPVESFVVYARTLGVAPASGEHHEMGRLPQFFADRFGWPELAADVARVHAALPAAERSRACVFAQDYGQAGAIDRFGPALGLPPAISGHNSYFLWGPRDCDGSLVIVLGDGRDRLGELFEEVELAAVHHCDDCMPYEDELPIWVCRRLRGSLSELWPRVRHYD